MPLTDTRIKSAKPSTKAIKLTDGHGLLLEVRPTGAKLWRYRYRIDGKENVFAAGEYAQPVAGERSGEAEARRRAGRLTLAEARIEREKWRDLVKRGIHPAQERRDALRAARAEDANTFEAVAREWVDKKKPSWTPYYLNQVERALKADLYPVVGQMPIRQVAAADLLTVLQKVEERGAESVAILLRQWSSAIFRYAVATLRADSDPAAALKGAIHKPKTKHNRPLSPDEIKQFFSAVSTYGGFRPTVIALRLMLLTFVRTVELRGAKWEELDLDRAEWRIPAERMKKREPHLVPLSAQAIGLLCELKTITGGRCYLLPNHRDPRRFMSATTLNRALERMGFCGRDGIGFSSHGFRATASTILNEMGYRSDVIERQLAHAERNKVRASYNQAEYLEERRDMMQQWADYLNGLESAGRVVPIGAERKSL
jgi:integrase